MPNIARARSQEIKIIENNTKDENISYELKKIRTTHLKKIEQLGAKIRLVDGFYLFFTPFNISNAEYY